MRKEKICRWGNVDYWTTFRSSEKIEMKQSLTFKHKQRSRDGIKPSLSFLILILEDNLLYCACFMCFKQQLFQELAVGEVNQNL